MGESTGAVFLSYASQDAVAARRIAEALRAAGVEVWFDQSELVGGDQWDAKIRGQIGSCALFIPVISVATQARLEGYFRIEWKLAAQRTHAMADEKAFLLPLVIDATRDQEAKVPAEFRAVQWTKLPLAPAQDGKTGDQALAVFVTRVKRLLVEKSEVGAALRRDESQELNHGESRRKAAPTRKPFRWLIPAVVTVIAVSVFAFWRTSRQPEPEAKSAATSPIARSEARQLADKAEQMSLNKYNSTADDYATAEGCSIEHSFSTRMTRTFGRFRRCSTPPFEHVASTMHPCDARWHGDTRKEQSSSHRIP